MKKNLTVGSSHGTFVVNKATGKVRSFKREKDGSHDMLNIYKFDMREWRRSHKAVSVPDHLDILDLGYWQHFSSAPYVEPAFDWRELMVELSNDPEFWGKKNYLRIERAKAKRTRHALQK